MGMAGAGAGLPAARTMLGDPVAPSAGFSVANLTCGTVTLVERSDVMDDAGIGWPAEIPAEKVQGTVTVWTMEITVTAGGVGGEGLLGAVTTSPVTEGPAGVARGIGARVIDFGTQVMIPGFSGTWGAQMPAR